MFIAHVLKVADNEYISEIYIAEDKARAIDRAVQDCQYSNVLANYLDEDSILTMQGLLEDKEDGNTETAMLADDVKMKYDAGGFVLTKVTDEQYLVYKCKFDECTLGDKEALWISN